MNRFQFDLVPSDSAGEAEPVTETVAVPPSQLTLDEARKLPKVLSIARICHVANKAFCEENGDNTHQSWHNSTEQQRDSMIIGVLFRLNFPNATYDDQHKAWTKTKVDEGWVYGEVKDNERKTHPCLVPYDELPELHRKKDALFQAIVDALK